MSDLLPLDLAKVFQELESEKYRSLFDELRSKLLERGHNVQRDGVTYVAKWFKKSNTN